MNPPTTDYCRRQKTRSAKLFTNNRRIKRDNVTTMATSKSGLMALLLTIHTSSTMYVSAYLSSPARRAVSNTNSINVHKQNCLSSNTGLRLQGQRCEGHKPAITSSWRTSSFMSNLQSGKTLSSPSTTTTKLFSNLDPFTSQKTENNDTSNNSTPPGPTIVIDPNSSNLSSTEIYSRAITRTLQWVGAAILFGLTLWGTTGNIDTAAEFFAGYLVEQSLSIDNLFVFLLLFDYFQVPLSSQDRVLNYGIYGAVVMRAIMIGLGSVALSRFHEILLVFAAILVYSSATALVEFVSDEEDEEEEDLSENSIVKFSTNLFDATDEFDADRFFTVVEGVKKATPLFICMIAVEISDVVFAVDSIPAVFGVTENPLIVFTSNMFAIMGLRSLYTILSKAAQDLEYLEPAVAVVLGFIGSKMVAEYFGFLISTEFSLAVVVTCLAAGVGLSTLSKQKEA